METPHAMRKTEYVRKGGDPRHSTGNLSGRDVRNGSFVDTLATKVHDDLDI